MSQSKTRHQFLLPSMIIAAAIFLGGCGGGSSGTSTTSVNPTDISDSTADFTKSTVDITDGVITNTLDNAASGLSLQNETSAFGGQVAKITKKSLAGKNYNGLSALNYALKGATINLPGELKQFGNAMNILLGNVRGIEGKNFSDLLGSQQPIGFKSLVSYAEVPAANCASGTATLDAPDNVLNGTANDGTATATFEDCVNTTTDGDDNLVTTTQNGTITIAFESEGVNLDETGNISSIDDTVTATITFTFDSFAVTVENSEGTNSNTLDGSFTIAYEQTIADGTFEASQGLSFSSFTNDVTAVSAKSTSFSTTPPEGTTLSDAKMSLAVSGNTVSSDLGDGVTVEVPTCDASFKTVLVLEAASGDGFQGQPALEADFALYAQATPTAADCAQFDVALAAPFGETNIVVIIPQGDGSLVYCGTDSTTDNDDYLVDIDDPNPDADGDTCTISATNEGDASTLTLGSETFACEDFSNNWNDDTEI